MPPRNKNAESSADSGHSPLYPKLIAFDLDYTLWDFWIDTHISRPLRVSDDKLVDRAGRHMHLYADVPLLLHRLAEQKVHLALCSRTQTPDLARDALRKLRVAPSGKAAIDFFDTLEIYPGMRGFFHHEKSQKAEQQTLGSKIKHFENIHRHTGIPYADMLFVSGIFSEITT